jgi:chitin synthase
VEGEAKGEAHGEGAGTFDGSSVPLRRWEDWERSRLRKLKRQERRKRELERAFPNGYEGGESSLVVPSSTRTSQYDGSDTMSLASSAEDDQWGGQIGGYNENSAQYPAPPVGLYQSDSLAGAKTVGAGDLEAMLEMGFDGERGAPGSRRGQPQSRLHQSGAGGAQGYTQLARAASPTTPNTPNTPHGLSTGSQPYSNAHARKRSGGGADKARYGPLGPLDPGSRL